MEVAVTEVRRWLLLVLQLLVSFCSVRVARWLLFLVLVDADADADADAVCVSSLLQIVVVIGVCGHCSMIVVAGVACSSS